MAYGPGLYPMDHVMLLQQHVHLGHLWLLLKLPIGHILHMSVKCILYFTYVDLQSSKVCVVAV